MKLYADCSMGHKTSFENCEHHNKGRSSVFDIKLAVLQLVIGLNMSQEIMSPFFRNMLPNIHHEIFKMSILYLEHIHLQIIVWRKQGTV